MFLLGEMRRQQHLTQAALSKQLGVSRSTVSMWENEEAQPDNAMLCRLADLFGVSIDALFGRENLDSHLKEEDKKLLSLFSDLSYDQLEINQGLLAVKKYQELEATHAQEVKEALFEYCGMDTYAEYVLFHFLKDKVSK